MEMILNENDLVVGARFENGTIQDYVDEANTFGLVRFEDSTVNWFLFNKEDSSLEMKTLYNKVISDPDHFIHDDFGEEIVLFNKKGSKPYSDMLQKIDDYLNDEMGI